MTATGSSTQDSFGFVDDGYNVDRYIRGVDRLHPAVELSIRVMQPADRAAWQVELSRLPEDERPAFNSATLAKRIVTWSLPRTPTAGNVGKLVPALYDKLFGVIFGETAGDPLPATGETPANDADADAKN